jgi:hypothetical protein
MDNECRASCNLGYSKAGVQKARVSSILRSPKSETYVCKRCIAETVPTQMRPLILSALAVVEFMHTLALGVGN